MVDYELEECLLKTLNHMSEVDISMLAILTCERTQIQGFISLRDILRFMIENFKGDISLFNRPLE